MRLWASRISRADNVMTRIMSGKKDELFLPAEDALVESTEDANTNKI